MKTKETTTRLPIVKIVQIKRNDLILTEDGEKPDGFCIAGGGFFPTEFLTRSSNMNRRERMVGEGYKIFAGPRVHRVFASRRGTLKNFPRMDMKRARRASCLEKFQILRDPPPFPTVAR